jgi:CheY-like chemotaxis protein
MTKVVYLEDDPIHATGLRQTLSAAGYTCVTLRGAKKIREFRKGRIHNDVAFIVSDIMMSFHGLYSAKSTANGVYTGLLLALDLRKKYPDVPIVFFSAFSAEGLRVVTKALATRIGLSGVVLKPEGYLGLCKVVDHYCATGSLHRGLVRKIWTALKIAPSIYGVGFDLKQLLPKCNADEEKHHDQRWRRR